MNWLVYKTFLIFGGILFSQGYYANPMAKSAHAQVSLISEQGGFQTNKKFTLAFFFELEKDWHIYWRNPGDSGERPKVKFHLPRGVTASDLIFTTPEKIAAGPFMAYGYKDRALVLVDIQPGDYQEKTLTVSADINWLECKEICLPARGRVSLSVNKVDQKVVQLNQATSKLFNRARLRLAKPANFSFSFAPEEEHIRLKLQLPKQVKKTNPELYFFAFKAGLIDHAAKQVVKIQGDEVHLLLPTDGNANKNELKNLSGELQLKENGQHIFSWVLHSSFENALGTLLLYVFFAFLGGMILNLMPCVLPVLSLKVMSLTQHGKHSFRHGLVFSAGVLLSFLALAVTLLLLRHIGFQFGWGFQMQTPWFVFFLAVVFLIFALNLFGVFEIGLGLASFGEVKAESAYGNSFTMGLLATLVATPCTAPFMGSALGFALGQPWFVSLLVFASLAIGMALPYLLLSINPSWLRVIPKPGPWMIKFKWFLGILMLGTVGWLLFVLVAQVTWQNFLAALFILVMLLPLAYLWGQRQSKSWPSKTPAYVVLLALVIMGVSLSTLQGKNGAAKNEWLPFKQATISQLEEEKRSYFIDFTADWCLSCKVNESMAFDESTYQLFKTKKVKIFKADFTNYDIEISGALEAYGRNSVPLYVLFDGVSGKTKLLPEILTKSILVDTLNKLKTKK